ncbi:unnamed protein product [Amoebophrya sp. A120]|nr:unnamed protein product [Amoebophrya sp. A120]|eukprot:GSA120T00004156001.1
MRAGLLRRSASGPFRPCSSYPQAPVSRGRPRHVNRDAAG